MAFLEMVSSLPDMPTVMLPTERNRLLLEEILDLSTTLELANQKTNCQPFQPRHASPHKKPLAQTSENQIGSIQHLI